MSLLYACTHLDAPAAPLPPSYPSSSASFHPLHNLYFCEECDAVRCDLCVAIEVASYFCPNCLFDVPGANVRADKNRCARSCFSCPQCTSSLSIQASDPPEPQEGGEDAAPSAPGPPYLLVCPGCKWSSKEVGWEFDKPTGIALQLQKSSPQTEAVQAEFDALKEHLESYITSSAPPTPHRTRVPSRHISQLTQMASKALHRDIPGMTAASKARRRMSGVKDGEAGREKVGWDEMGEYVAKGSWREEGWGKGLEEVEMMKELQESGARGVGRLERRWGKSCDADRLASAILPQRIPLKTKLTKRCPEANCRHLLIQPDTKGVRMKIKMVAMNYLPVMELGRRRRRIAVADLEEEPSEPSAEDLERRRRERRRTRGGVPVKEEDESLGKALRAGETYTFQLALTNPLYDPIQIRLTQPHAPRHAPAPNNNLHIVTPHFTINALKDAWAYDEDDEEDEGAFGESDAGVSEDGMSGTTGTNTGTNVGTLSRKSRLSVLAGGSARDKKHRESGVEKKGNTSKIALEVEVLPGATGSVEFDLEVRYTYRADGEGTPAEREGGGKEERMKEEYKTFTFWVRANIGEVA
ncbi:hypothetical protein IAT38_001150 [Cryptococcus sp. DSM 104549]